MERPTQGGVGTDSGEVGQGSRCVGELLPQGAGEVGGGGDSGSVLMGFFSCFKGPLRTR